MTPADIDRVTSLVMAAYSEVTMLHGRKPMMPEFSDAVRAKLETEFREGAPREFVRQYIRDDGYGVFKMKEDARGQAEGD